MAPARARRGAAARVGARGSPRGATAFPKSPASASSISRGAPREGWREALPVFPSGEDVATRDAGESVNAAP